MTGKDSKCDVHAPIGNPRGVNRPWAAPGAHRNEKEAIRGDWGFMLAYALGMATGGVLAWSFLAS